MALEYVLITPARNEEAFIEKTIQSVISQTVLPKKWVIVSDGSTDRTDDIVKEYAEKNHWIELIRMPERRDRNFAAKAVCFNTAFERLRNLSYDVIANVDADISFGPEYFEFLLEKFGIDSKLGVAGTRYLEDDYQETTYNYRDVAGQCQVFRRECLEQLGGYFPSKLGGVDWIAVRMARMNSWVTITFGEKTFFHHRLMSSAERNAWVARIRTGRKDYILGNHPLWESLRIMYQLTRKPYVVGGLLMLYGYLWAAITRIERPISAELLTFHRREQMQRLKTILRNLPRFKQTMTEG